MNEIEALHADWAYSHGLTPIDELAIEKKLSAKNKRRLRRAAVGAAAIGTTAAILDPKVTRTASRTGVRVGRGNYRAAINRRPSEIGVPEVNPFTAKPARTTVRVQAGKRVMWATRQDRHNRGDEYAARNPQRPRGIEVDDTPAKWTTGNMKVTPKGRKPKTRSKTS